MQRKTDFFQNFISASQVIVELLHQLRKILISFIYSFMLTKHFTGVLLKRYCCLVTVKIH